MNIKLLAILIGVGVLIAFAIQAEPAPLPQNTAAPPALLACASDSDGNNRYLRGEVQIIDDQQQPLAKQRDFCSSLPEQLEQDEQLAAGPYLQEQLCVNGQTQSYGYACVNGCVDGACVQTVSCQDTDGSTGSPQGAGDYFTAGLVSGITDTGTVLTHRDSCRDGLLTEYSCDASGTEVLSQTVTCAYGCFDENSCQDPGFITYNKVELYIVAANDKYSAHQFYENNNQIEVDLDSLKSYLLGEKANLYVELTTTFPIGAEPTLELYDLKTQTKTGSCSLTGAKGYSCLLGIDVLQQTVKELVVKAVYQADGAFKQTQTPVKIIIKPIGGAAADLRAEYVKNFIGIEKTLVRYPDRQFAARQSGKILLQVEEHGEAWYVYPDNLQRYYLADGATAYQLLRRLGLGVTAEALAQIPVGFVSSNPAARDAAGEGGPEKFALGADSDNDGLEDKLEEAIGTDPARTDSDADGFSDKAEIESGHDPLSKNKLKTNAALQKRLNGKILLQVSGPHARGQAWYLFNGKRYYLRDGFAAYQIMRRLSVGATNLNLRRITVGDL